MLKSGEREIYYSCSDLAWLMDKLGNDVESRAAPAEKRLDWPLVVGKEWQSKAQIEYPLQRSTEERRRIASIEARQLVTVPAGTFWAYHIVVKDPTGKMTSEQWYAPEVQWLIKEKTYLSYGEQIRELLEYRLTPR